MVVLPSIGVVIVGQLWQVDHSFVAHLKNGYADSYIICRFQILSCVVFKVIFANIDEKLGVEGSQVAGYKRIRSVFIAGYGGLRERSRVSDSPSDTQEIAVDEPSLVLLEDGIEKF